MLVLYGGLPRTLHTIQLSVSSTFSDRLVYKTSRFDIACWVVLHHHCWGKAQCASNWCPFGGRPYVGNGESDDDRYVARITLDTV